MSSSPKTGGVVCKACNKPGFKKPDGSYAHERRTKPDDYGGRRAAPEQPKREEDGEPNREHILHRRVIGGKGE